MAVTMLPAAQQARGRAEALARYEVLDLPAEPELQAVLRLVTAVTGAPTATLNILDDVRQTNYVTEGFVGSVQPRDEAICAVTLAEARTFVVPDVRLEPRLAGNPHVDGEGAQLRFYAGAPLVTPDGYGIGTLCAFGNEVRHLEAAQVQGLEDLAAQAMALLERRRLARLADEANRAKSAFLASVSHEIRTPMNGVLGMLDLLLTTGLDDAQRGHAQLAHRSAETLLALLDDVLDLSKGEAGHIVLSSRPFSPVELVEDVIAVLSPLTVTRGTTLACRTAGAVPELVVGDPVRLRQVVVNLVGNAVKFTPSGGVVVEIAYVQDELVLKVIDTGEGIAADELPHLFSPFVQGASGRAHGGTGLGLVISRDIVELMGGELEVESVLGEGSTFTVRVLLPAGEPEEVADLTGQHVLVVDDGDVNRLVATGLLQVLGARSVAVASGAEALEALQRERFDAVLLDLVMPGLDGPATARAITALGLTPPPRLVGLTGSTQPEDVRACREAGMVAVLAKPLRPEDLAIALS